MEILNATSFFHIIFQILVLKRPLHPSALRCIIAGKQVLRDGVWKAFMPYLNLALFVVTTVLLLSYQQLTGDYLTLDGDTWPKCEIEKPFVKPEMRNFNKVGSYPIVLTFLKPEMRNFDKIGSYPIVFKWYSSLFTFTGVTILLLLIPSLFLVKGAPLKGKWQNAVPWSVLDL